MLLATQLGWMLSVTRPIYVRPETALFASAAPALSEQAETLNVNMQEMNQKIGIR